MGISPRRLAAIAALTAVGGVTAVGLLDRDGGSSGSAPVSPATSPQDLSGQLSANDTALRGAIDAWRAAGDPPSAPPPEEVIVRARYLQSAVSLLATHRNLAAATTPLLPTGLASELRELTLASRRLRRLSAGPRRAVRIGPPPPLAELLSHYTAAQRRFGIGGHYLAAIHLVESKFGRVKSNSVAGAKGPMQFLPATWDIYGRGGDIHDSHDAILGAANLLRHNGAPRNYSRALYAYNPSRLYVDAVRRYARVIARDTYAIYFLYSWRP